MTYYTYSPNTLNTTSTTYTLNSNITGSTGTVLLSSDSGNLKGHALHVNGDASVSGDLKVAGISIKETLDRIEDRLAILHPNTDLEERWEELRNLRKQYMDLEKELLEKEKMWNILKE